MSSMKATFLCSSEELPIMLPVLIFLFSPSPISDFPKMEFTFTLFGKCSSFYVFPIGYLGSFVRRHLCSDQVDPAAADELPGICTVNSNLDFLFKCKLIFHNSPGADAGCLDNILFFNGSGIVLPDIIYGISIAKIDCIQFTDFVSFLSTFMKINRQFPMPGYKNLTCRLETSMGQPNAAIHTCVIDCVLYCVYYTVIPMCNLCADILLDPILGTFPFQIFFYPDLANDQIQRQPLFRSLFERD